MWVYFSHNVQHANLGGIKFNLKLYRAPILFHLPVKKKKRFYAHFQYALDSTSERRKYIVLSNVS